MRIASLHRHRRRRPRDCSPYARRSGARAAGARFVPPWHRDRDRATRESIWVQPSVLRWSPLQLTFRREPRRRAPQNDPGMRIATRINMIKADQLAARLDRLTTLEPGPYPVISLYLNLQPDQQGRHHFEAF